MKLRTLSYGLIVVAAAVLLASILGVRLGVVRWQPLPAETQARVVQAWRLAAAARHGSSFPEQSSGYGGDAEFYAKPVNNRYRYRNEFPADQTQRLPLYLIDTETGQETRLGDDSHAAVFGALDEAYLLWFFGGEFHAYHLATGEDTWVATLGGYLSFPQIADVWVAFGEYNGGGSSFATLYAANLQTGELITLTQKLAAGDAWVNGYFGISSQLAAWFEPPSTIVVYDLNVHSEITRLTNINVVFNEQYLDVYDLTPGETVVTWSRNYGYDLVTHSYFSIGNIRPPDRGNQLTSDMSRIQEQERMLSWTFDMKDGTQRHVRAPLLDATPSTALCVDGQNLVQNGDLEDIGTQNLWQQSGNASDLIVNDLPPDSPHAGQWAIRLGRYSNAQPALQQTLNIPSGVKGITLAFDVRAHSWDIWGGDQLQVDLIDPVTNQSILVTPVQWNNVQLASGDWVPMQVSIENWPGIDTPLNLVLRAQTDWAFPTDFTVDNIRFITACQ